MRWVNVTYKLIEISLSRNMISILAQVPACIVWEVQLSWDPSLFYSLKKKTHVLETCCLSLLYLVFSNSGLNDIFVQMLEKWAKEGRGNRSSWRCFYSEMRNWLYNICFKCKEIKCHFNDCQCCLTVSDSTKYLKSTVDVFWSSGNFKLCF